MSRSERRSVILGTGSELPSKIVTNHDLEKMVDTSDEWITVRTGIKERRVLEEGKGNADMAYEAAMRALDDAHVDAERSRCHHHGHGFRRLSVSQFRLRPRGQARRAQCLFL